MAVAVFHPDGAGWEEVRWTVPAGAVVDLGGGFGNDWGIRADTSCITTLGRVGRWSDGGFAVAWRAGALLAADSADVPQRELPPDERR